jgi:uncharacterized protein YuzE
MIVTLDPVNGDAYIYLVGVIGKGEAVRQKHCGPDIILDFNSAGQVIGIELPGSMLLPELASLAVEE